MTYIVVSKIRKRVKEISGKRVGRDFLEALNEFVEKKVDDAARAYNGGKKTLDNATAWYSGIRVK